MSESSNEDLQAWYSIAAVERDTGLSKDTLRVWERRYGFPAPERDANGERIYPSEQLGKLRLIRRLLDLGYRPSKVVASPEPELSCLLSEACSASPARLRSSQLQYLIDLIRLHRSAELRAALQQSLLKQGLQRFVTETVTPLNELIGDAWLRGELDVAEEHLYTEMLQNVMRSAIGAQSASPGQPPRVLLTTVPEEQHALGLLMAEAMLTAEGAQCVSLGVQTPLQDIVGAVTHGGFDVLALSFSAAFPARQAADSLHALRSMLPGAVTIWAGGAAIRGRIGPIPGVELILSIETVVVTLEAWRQQHCA